MLRKPSMSGEKAASAPVPVMGAPASPESYRPHIGEGFALSGGAGGVLNLKSVDLRIDDEFQLCFSLLFVGRGALLPQGTYPLSHPALGEMNLFLVPIQTKKDGVCYEAVFNLLRGQDQ
jgi:hypothetical protein